MIYLDNSATTSPKPPSVIRAVQRALTHYSANPGRSGHSASMRTADAVFRVREKAKAFFNVRDESDVIFTSGCTQALNTVIKGVLSRGDHVVISSMEHNSVVRPLHAMSESGMITYSVAHVLVDDDERTIDSFRSAINERTRLIVCTHASNVFGNILPVRRLCALAHQYNILFCLDAAQSAGVLPIDLLQDGYDFVCCAGHKGLYGAEGIGLLLINCDMPMKPLIEGGTGSESSNLLMPDYYPDRLESGTLNIPGILSLGAGIDFVRSQSLTNIHEKELHLIRLLYRSVSKNNRIQLYSDEPTTDRFVPVLSLNIGQMSSEKVSSYLDRQFGIATRAGLHCAPLAHQTMGSDAAGTVRIAPSVFTTREEIEKTAFALHKISKFS